MTDTVNPRFPHMCRILRYADTDPMQDQPQSLSSDGAACCFCCSEVPEGAVVLYQGVCRSFNRDTVSDNGEVITSYRTLALPLKQDQWTEETMPLEGDKVEVIKNGFKEYGQVVDKRPGNLGTHILWKYVRN